MSDDTRDDRPGDGPDAPDASDEAASAPHLHLVADSPDDVPTTDPARDTPGADPDTGSEADAPGPRDPLLARAERIAELPLDERPAAFDGLNRAVVAELNTLEEG